MKNKKLVFMKFIAISKYIFTIFLFLTLSSRQAIAIIPTYPASSISAEGTHNLAIMSNGTLWAWGINTYGQLGDGTTDDRNVPVQIGTDINWISVEVGDGYSVALKSDGTLWTWGRNHYGQLGDGTVNDKNIPNRIEADKTWIYIDAGSAHALALDNAGKLYSWGKNTYGQLGNGDTNNRSIPTLVGTGWIAVDAGLDHVLAIKNNKTLWAWGRNNYGQLGNGTTTDTPNPWPLQIPQLPGIAWDYVNAGGDSSFALTNKTLYSWGSNRYGQLGRTSDETTLTVVGDGNWAAVDAGFYHVLAVKNDGTNRTLWAWGRNFYGQLGNGIFGEENNQTEPLQIGTDTDWAFIVGGGAMHSIAVKNNGTIWAWGNNTYKQLGEGTGINRYTPVQITDVRPWIDLSSNSFTFKEIEGGGNPPDQTLNISTAGYGQIHWTAESNSSWLHISPDPASGVEVGTVTISVDKTGLALGVIYNGVITVSDPDAGNSPQIVSVSFYLIAPLVITTTSLNEGTVKVAYNASLSATGGFSATGGIPVYDNGKPLGYKWSAIGDSMPSGLSLDSDGTITGIIQTENTYSFNVQVQDNDIPPSVSSAWITLNILLRPDLVITSLTAPLVVTTTVTISDTIKNQEVTTSGPSLTKYYLSSNLIWDNKDAFLGSRTVPALIPGGVNTYNTTVAIPNTVGSGKFYIIAVADGNKTIIEPNEINNIKTFQTQINRSDLNISTLSVPSSTTKKKPISISDTVKNLGLAESQPTIVKYYLSADNKLDELKDIYIGNRKVSSKIAVKKVDKGKAKFAIPSRVSLGSYYLIAVVDPMKTVPEMNDSNNIMVSKKLMKIK